MRNRVLGLATLAIIAAVPAAAQAPKVSGLVQVWYNQVLDNNLRLNSAYATPNGAKYFNLRSEFQENGFSVRRTEIKLSGTITDEVEYEVMFDPSINNNGNSKNILLQDAVIKYKVTDGLELKVGQMKNQQTMEGLTSSGELLFVERSQLGRVFGDVRDRGAVLTYGFGDNDFGTKLSAGVFNGNGKAGETQGNAAKDLIARADFTLGKTVKFGAYTLQGSTDQADTKGSAILGDPTKLPAGWPSATEIYDNKDKTTNMGVYAQYQDDTFYGAFEFITGQLGRRNPTLPTIAREGLTQKFQGMALTGGYTVGRHTFLARYDVMNFNSGDQWYTATSPYIAANGDDYSPKYTETSAGYLYAFKPEKLKAANIKVNFINRSKNFLKPRADQSGPQGGNNLVVAFQIGF